MPRPLSYLCTCDRCLHEFYVALALENTLYLEMYNTDGSQGAARGAAFGNDFYTSLDDAFQNLKIINNYNPEHGLVQKYDECYQVWKEQLQHQLQK